MNINTFLYVVYYLLVKIMFVSFLHCSTQGLYFLINLNDIVIYYIRCISSYPKKNYFPSLWYLSFTFVIFIMEIIYLRPHLPFLFLNMRKLLFIFDLKTKSYHISISMSLKQLTLLYIWNFSVSYM